MMGKVRSRAIKAFSVAAILVGVTATTSSAANVAWYYTDMCPYLGGCGMISHMGPYGATTDDGGCPNSVGERLRYTSGGVTYYSPKYWGSDFIAVYRTTTTAYEVTHY
jgi:hypothetical protein